MSHFPWLTWLEVHLLVMGGATGLVLAVADRRGYSRFAVAGGLLAVSAAMQTWITYGWRVHPWYFVGPVALILAARDISGVFWHPVSYKSKSATRERSESD